MNITTLTRRYSRRPLAKPNGVYYLWRFVGNGVRTVRALTTAPQFDDTALIAGKLKKDGIAVAPSDAFLSDAGRRALVVAAEQVLDRSRRVDRDAIEAAMPPDTRTKKFLVHLASFPHGIDPDDPLLKVGLDPRLLEIVATYLGLWPSLYSIGAWLNYPTDAPPELSQLWHRDPEDIKLIKAFIYLSDVDEHCGPFTYIPKTHPFGARNRKARQLQKRSRVDDDRMTATFPPAAWRVCTGPANTMILADTVGYHRGGKPIAGHRILMTFSYTSGTPIDDSGLWLQRPPAWISRAIQKSAVAWLVDGAHRRQIRKQKHQ